MASYRNIIEKDTSEVDQGDFYWFRSGFSDEEIDRIHSFAENYEYREGQIFNGVNDGSVRRSKLKWLPSSQESAWLYKKMFELANKANDACYKFRLHYALDDMQYTLYEGNSNGKYDWHIDTDKGEASLRKISFTLQLSDPSEYEGGDLEFMTSRDTLQAPKKQYTSVIFPSYLLHRVTPVTRGVRKSLVLWVGGIPFR